MTETAIERKIPAPLKEKGQYALAFSVIAVVLYVAGFPLFLLFFVGVLTFFIWKVFSSEGRHETRRIFEFYLSANEMLRDDGRRWYGFEIQETIARGEAIVRSISAPPPLVYFGLGALYQKIGDHTSAVKNLAQVVGETPLDESAIVFPTKDLREYVRMLRKIERAPAEAPLTASAVRSLERLRKNRGKQLLEYSSSQITESIPLLPKHEQRPESVVDAIGLHESEDITEYGVAGIESKQPTSGEMSEKHLEQEVQSTSQKGKVRNSDRSSADRKTISEVLHDIYDGSVQ